MTDKPTKILITSKVVKIDSKKSQSLAHMVLRWNCYHDRGEKVENTNPDLNFFAELQPSRQRDEDGSEPERASVRAEPAPADHQEQPQPGAVVVEKATSNHSGRQEAAATTVLPKSAGPSSTAILAESVRSGTFLLDSF